MRKKHADAIAEGVAIALAAARLIVKNHILVDTIADGENFEVGHFDAVARNAMETLAKESEKAARRLKKMQRAAFGRYSLSDGTHDYRDRDVKNLRQRRKHSEQVAAKLREMMDDESAVRALVESSREAAWTDVANNLQNRLRVEAMRPDADPGYESMRDARIQALLMIDLQNLEAQAKKRQEWAGQ